MIPGKRKREIVKFRLFVADNTPNSVLALANLNAICRKHLPDAFEIEVVDVFREPRRALAEGVFLTPTVIRLAPSPLVRIVGTLSHLRTVLHALGLEGEAA